MCINVCAGCDCSVCYLYFPYIFLKYFQNIHISHLFLYFLKPWIDFPKYPISFKTPGDFSFFRSTGSRISSCIFFILPAIFQNHMFSLIGFSILLSICKKFFTLFSSCIPWLLRWKLFTHLPSPYSKSVCGLFYQEISLSFKMVFFLVVDDLA